MLGFIKPKKIRMKNISGNKPINAKGKLKQICPIIKKSAPNKVAALGPVIMAETHPPGIDVI
ncbi:hypothetical protein FE79_14840 [Staphylococcus aureus]|nr:hypothetical protein FE79_14840 [Staphylococcus aureus]